MKTTYFLRKANFTVWLVLLIALLPWAATASGLVILTKQLPPDTNGVPYSQAIVVTGGQAPYKWQLVAGAFPDSLIVNATNGIISGTTHGAAWELQYPFRATVSVTDSTGANSMTTFSVPLVAPATSGSSSPGNYSLTVIGGTGNGSYAAGTTVTISATNVPAGQIFSSWTGAAVANPQAASTTLVMPAASTVVTANYVISPPPPASTNYSLTVIGGTGSGNYVAGATVSIAATNIPAGQIFNGWTGATVVNPQTPSTTLIMPTASTVVTANYHLPAPPAAPLTLAAAILPPVMVGTIYSQPLSAAGGHAPYTWSVASGSLPPGLALDPNSGVINGLTTASAAWYYSYPFRVTVLVADTAGSTAYQSYNLSIIPSTNTTFSLTVNGGNINGGAANGSFVANTPVSINAVAPNAASTFTGWTGAAVANPSALSTTLVMPAANTVVTANFINNAPSFQLTVAGGIGTGIYPAGTTIPVSAGSGPSAGQVFQAWTGGPVANPFAASTTLVMPSNNVSLLAIFGATANPPATIPQPVASHPRLWVTTNDLPRLRSWACATNPVYTQGVQALLGKAINDYNTLFFPGGVENPNWPDSGDINAYGGVITEQYMYIFGLNSLIDPTPANRSQYARCARNLIMHVMNLAVQGFLTNAPFRDPDVILENRNNFYGEAYPLIADWIYNATDTNGAPILSAADKATIRQVFLLWAAQEISAAETGLNPEPSGTMNNHALLPGGNAFRYAANNYYTGHARLVTMMSLVFDPADDPAVNPALPVSILGNSLRSYIADATGAWLYQQYAIYGDPTNVCADYNLPASASVGVASGGLSVEGTLYGHSYTYLFGELLALKTAGFATPQMGGPQTALANNPPVWDRYVQGMISSLTPLQETNPIQPNYGLTYGQAAYGDLLREYPTPEFGNMFAMLGLLDRQNGYTNRLNAERWYMINAEQGGASQFYSRLAYPWSWGVQETILAFLFLDPAYLSPTDPHANYPVTFYDAPTARLVDRTDWGSMATLFDYRASWQSINHQQADAGQFEFYRKGEWLTKGVANYDIGENGSSSLAHNTLSLQNWCVNGVPTDMQWNEGTYWTNGSSGSLGANAGDPVTSTSFQPGYDFLHTDLTPLYNRPGTSPQNAAMDNTDVNRSILWLKPDVMVVYDRATSKHTGLFKRFNLTLAGLPHVTNNVITSFTPGGQALTVTELLPLNSQLSTAPVASLINPVAELDPAQYLLSMEDPSLPADTRFLHIFQGNDPGVLPLPASLVQSTAGTLMDGALFGDTCVWFVHDETVPFVGNVYNVPLTAVKHYVTGCVPGASYTVVGTVTAAGRTVTITPAAGGLVADQAGVLTFGF